MKGFTEALKDFLFPVILRMIMDSVLFITAKNIAVDLLILNIQDSYCVFLSSFYLL